MSTEPSTPREGESLQLRIATIIQAGRNDTAFEVAGKVLDAVPPGGSVSDETLVSLVQKWLVRAKFYRQKADVLGSESCQAFSDATEQCVGDLSAEVSKLITGRIVRGQGGAANG